MGLGADEGPDTVGHRDGYPAQGELTQTGAEQRPAGDPAHRHSACRQRRRQPPARPTMRPDVFATSSLVGSCRPPESFGPAASAPPDPIRRGSGWIIPLG